MALRSSLYRWITRRTIASRRRLAKCTSACEQRTRRYGTRRPPTLKIRECRCIARELNSAVDHSVEIMCTLPDDMNSQPSQFCGGPRSARLGRKRRFYEGGQDGVQRE